MLRTIVFSLAASALLAGVASAGATQTRQLNVSYGDLNIHSRAGVQVLMGRLEHAAGAVCGGPSFAREALEAQRFRDCRRDALDKAVAGIASPELMAAYNGQAQLAQVARK